MDCGNGEDIVEVNSAPDLVACRVGVGYDSNFLARPPEQPSIAVSEDVQCLNDRPSLAGASTSIEEEAFGLLQIKARLDRLPEFIPLSNCLRHLSPQPALPRWRQHFSP